VAVRVSISISCTDRFPAAGAALRGAAKVPACRPQRFGDPLARPQYSPPAGNHYGRIAACAGAIGVKRAGHRRSENRAGALHTYFCDAPSIAVQRPPQPLPGVMLRLSIAGFGPAKDKKNSGKKRTKREEMRK
jgi:hypothetical protein